MNLSSPSFPPMHTRPTINPPISIPQANLIMKLDTATIVLVLAMLLALHVGLISSNNHEMMDAESEHRVLGAKYYSPSGKHAGRLTCNKYPRVCHVKGSPGPDCCKKKCVDVKKDNLNCGMCGNKCAHQETCCNGRCVNPLRDRKHCGGCGNKCNKGDVCYYGMCSYA